MKPQYLNGSFWRAPTLLSMLCVLLFGSGALHADEITIAVEGVGADEAANVRAQLGGGWVSGGAVSTQRRRDRFVNRSEDEAVIALRPYGYYNAVATAQLERLEGETWLLNIKVEPGAPVQVVAVDIKLQGEGAAYPALLEWRGQWPISTGDRLVQTVWADEKQSLGDVLDEHGFLTAEFIEHRIELDLEQNQASLFLTVDTGPRAILGDIEFKQDFLDDRVLKPVPRFEAGDPYLGWLVEQLRMDLWKLGMFEGISLKEHRDLDVVPPVVNLEVALEESHPNTHQGTIGYGTDTEFRMQYRWQRHVLSERGDSMAAGFGYKTRDDELLMFGEYRLPRKVENHEYWLFNMLATQEQQVFELDVDGREDRLPIADGPINDLLTRFGRVRLRNPTFSREQIIETIFVQHIAENNDFSLLDLNGPGLPDFASVNDNPDFEDLLPAKSVQSLAFGMDWDWPEIRGRGFDLEGHRERASVFVSNEAWGSDVDYAQVYLSSRWNIRLADNWRLLLRGEVGASEADVEEFSLDIDGLTFGVSVTELPFLYRFKAGGSHSVRGYAYDSLSNNGIGSNNIVTGSVELEYRVRSDWSVAAFVDAGDAFNDWSNLSLRKGVGLGVRWYTIGFPLRLDVAQAQDLEGKPWRVHFTIGSPLF